MAKDIDWLQCERDFATGNFSNCQLAEKYNVSESAIRDRAKRYKWLKDLSEATASATRAKLLRDDLSEQLRGTANRTAVAQLEADPTAKPPTEREIVNQAADMRVEIVKQHRKGTARVHRLVETAAGKIEEAFVLAEEVSDIAKLVGAAEAMSRMHKNAVELDVAHYSLDATPPAPTTQEDPRLTRLLGLISAKLDGRRPPITVGPPVIEHVMVKK